MLLSVFNVDLSGWSNESMGELLRGSTFGVRFDKGLPHLKSAFVQSYVFSGSFCVSKMYV